MQFQDIEAHSPLYSISDFEEMFFSSGTYVSPNEYSPDGEDVFGSMRDYLSIMSDGEFTVTGYVLNDDQGDGTPEWLTLPQTKSYYDSHSGSTFTTDVFNAASTAGLNTSTNSTTKLAIIYAGQAYRGDNSGLWPRAFQYSGYYINSELFEEGAPFHSEHANAKFQEIGINVHEFLHLAGLPDLGANGFFDVMNAGSYCGPNSRGACPAPLNPEARYKKGWISFDTITTDVSFQADYYLRDPEVFKIAHSTDSGNYWLIETRDFTSTMTIGNTSTEDYNAWIYQTFYGSYPDKGVLIWRVENNNWGTVLQADGVRWTGYPQISKGTPFPGSGNVNVLSPWSDPRTISWAPNTKPSTNVGMEIVDEGSDWYSLDLYAYSPEDASPSKPYNIGLTWQSNHPKITWDANGEPDLDHYEVYKKRGSGSYSYYASTTNTYYVDNSEWKFSWPNTKIYVYYKIKAVDEDDYESVFSDEKRAAVSDYESKRIAENEDVILKLNIYRLSSNYPNPFNPTTIIEYQLARSGFVTLDVYNMLGEKVAELVNGFEEAGYYSIEFDGSDLPSGIYLYKIQAGDFSDVKKMLLLK
ncbi:MAG: T9SS type A sorting domain-containing protein [bacterium]